MIDLADPETDVEELYFRFKNYIFNHHKDVYPPPTLNGKPVAEFFGSFFHYFFHFIRCNEDMGIMRFLWCRLGFIEKMDIGEHSPNTRYRFVK